ncbi:acyl-CoA carboxylase subunit beta [Salinirubellus salinus]|uniref:Acyl-CoA carboxylase subunit beta n=1 Tax=Salinirubellus salinus TaxID=1364945 RepID=A0A9E7UBW9_9EURY|nr:acyl-CoA carboxylase subunit beta [Salinirubellus salinus]UWM55698.1 acyl-CoA carboxylase subunit beta [Salinirubellus salinus]
MSDQAPEPTEPVGTGDGETVDPLAELEARRAQARAGGGPERVAAQHERGKMTARERIDYLLDDGTFREIDTFVEHRSQHPDVSDRTYPGDAVVTGYGDVEGRKVVVFAHDFTVLGGSVGEVVGQKVSKALDHAVEKGVPIIGLNDSAGARIQEGVDSLVGFAKIFKRNTDASGLVPQISCIMGPCAGGATYSPALTDFTFMVEGTSHAFLTGPDVVETVTGERVSMAELGGAHAHTSKSGFAHAVYPDEEATLDAVRHLLSYLPLNEVEDPPHLDPWDDPDRDCEFDMVPQDPKKPYDATEVVEELVDEGSFFEVHGSFARNVVVGFGRLDGRSVGVVANQPRVNAGTLDIEASQKAARFVRTCDSFNVPIVTLVDVPGFMPGTAQEHDGVIRHGAKLIYAYAEASVPLLTVVTRKAYGGAYIVMGSKELGADVNYAWPGAEMAVLGPRGAVNILHREEIQSATDPEARRQELMDEYRAEFANPYGPARRGHVDDVIDPAETRRRLIDDLELLERKRVQPIEKTHGNVPL